MGYFYCLYDEKISKNREITKLQATSTNGWSVADCQCVTNEVDLRSPKKEDREDQECDKCYDSNDNLCDYLKRKWTSMTVWHGHPQFVRVTENARVYSDLPNMRFNQNADVPHPVDNPHCSEACGPAIYGRNWRPNTAHVISDGLVPRTRRLYVGEPIDCVIQENGLVPHNAAVVVR